MLHEIDPRANLQKRIGDVSHIQVMHNQVLVATYERPDKTTGGILLPQSAKNEDKWQGKVGLIIALGSQAFVDDDRTQFGDVRPQVGDWAAYRMSDGWQLQLKGNPSPDNPKGERHCRMLIDVDIKLIISHPDDLI